MSTTITLTLIGIIIVSVIIAIIVYFSLSGKSYSKKESKPIKTDQTEQVLDKHFSNRESFESVNAPPPEVDTSIRQDFEFSEKAKEIVNDIKRIIPDTYFEKCIDSRLTMGSAICYANFKASKDTPLEADIVISLVLLDIALRIDHLKKNNILSETIKSTDIISYDPNTKTVIVSDLLSTVNNSSRGLAGIVEIPKGTYTLIEFAKFVNDTDIGKVIDDGRMKSMGVCDICGDSSMFKM